VNSNGGGDGVLVLDSNGQSAMSVIRSLGRRGVSVTAGGRSPRSLGMLSRYSDGRYVHPDPGDDREAFVRHLVEHLDRSDYFAVVPVVDHTSTILARHKAEMERTGTVVACEDWETFERAYDKGRFFEMAASLDVPTPETRAPSSASEVAAFADEIEYPVVIKPRSKSHLTGEGYAITVVTDDHYAESPGELRETYRRIVRERDPADGHYPLVQEYVPGETTTTVALADGGEILAYFQEERLRTHPSSGGNSALLGALREPTMLEYARRVLGRLDWTGPAMVEFMRTPDGEFYLIEVNGRYWGSLPFAVESGVDFPWLHYLQLHGIDPSPFVEYGEYRTDLVQRRLLYEDLKWLRENLGDGNVGALVPFLGAFGEARHTFVDLADPVPTACALLQAARLGGGAALRRVFGGVT
jgi:predicted ATP-grasp superfamily ATP-dependent carboligase